MRKQLYYEWRGRSMTRLLALTIFLGVSGALFVMAWMSRTSIGKTATSIIAVSLTSIGFVALLVVATVLAIDSGNRLFSKPHAYLTALTPVRGWKMLAARLMVTFVDYGVVLLVGITAIVIQSMALMMQWKPTIGIHAPTTAQVFMAVMAVESLLKTILLVFFARAMKQSVFASIPARALLAVLTFFAATWIWSALDILLLPLSTGSMNPFGPWININLDMYSVPTLIGYTVLSVLKLVGFFIPTAMLIEKKMNL